MILIHPGQDTKFFQGSFIDVNQLWPYRDQTIVINAASEHWGVDPGFILQIHDALALGHFDFWILSHHPGDHKITPRIIFYPWWYLHGLHCFKKNIECKELRQNLLGCLHGNPRPHRISHYLQLKNRFDLNHFHVTFWRTQKEPRRADDVELNENEHTQWQLLMANLEESGYRGDPVTIDLPAFTDSYINLVLETTVIDRIFVTEKTWKPIAAGQLFLVFGNPGSVKFLRSLGVDTFDDIIDHDSYDHIKDWRHRMNRIHDIINDLTKQDIASIWNSTRSRRELNKQNFFHGYFGQKYGHPVVDDFLQKMILSMKTSSF